MGGVTCQEDRAGPELVRQTRLHPPGHDRADPDLGRIGTKNGPNDLKAALRREVGDGLPLGIEGEIVGPAMAAIEGDQHAARLQIEDPPQ